MTILEAPDTAVLAPGAPSVRAVTRSTSTVPAPSRLETMTVSAPVTSRVAREPVPPVTDRALGLVGAGIDTWLIGGLSLVVLAVVATLQPLSNTVPSVGTQLRNLVLVAPTLSLFVNYPHFLASYRLAYWRRDAVLRHPFALLFVPTAIVVAALLAYATFDSTVVLGSHPIHGFGSRLAGWLIGLMFLTVGWHYVKQAYGCMRVGARLRGYSIPTVEQRVLRYALFPLWASVWARANTTHGDFDFSGLHYGSLGLPRWVVLATNLGIVLGALGIVVALVRLWRISGRVPPLMMVVPLAAMFAWWVPACYNPTFFVLVPMFHSLQYLPFASKVERGRLGSRIADPRRARRRLAVTAVAIAVAGWIAFEIGPGVVDSATGSSHRIGMLFFAAMIPALVNIHHYFIDHVIWRAQEPEVFSHLMAPLPR